MLPCVYKVASRVTAFDQLWQFFGKFGFGTLYVGQRDPIVQKDYYN